MGKVVKVQCEYCKGMFDLGYNAIGIDDARGRGHYFCDECVGVVRTPDGDVLTPRAQVSGLQLYSIETRQPSLFIQPLPDELRKQPKFDVNAYLGVQFS